MAISGYVDSVNNQDDQSVFDLSNSIIGFAQNIGNVTESALNGRASGIEIASMTILNSPNFSDMNVGDMKKVFGLKATEEEKKFKLSHFDGNKVNEIMEGVFKNFRLGRGFAGLTSVERQTEQHLRDGFSRKFASMAFDTASQSIDEISQIANSKFGVLKPDQTMDTEILKNVFKNVRNSASVLNITQGKRTSQKVLSDVLDNVLSTLPNILDERKIDKQWLTNQYLVENINFLDTEGKAVFSQEALQGMAANAVSREENRRSAQFRNNTSTLLGRINQMDEATRANFFSRAAAEVNSADSEEEKRVAWANYVEDAVGVNIASGVNADTSLTELIPYGIYEAYRSGGSRKGVLKSMILSEPVLDAISGNVISTGVASDMDAFSVDDPVRNLQAGNERIASYLKSPEIENVIKNADTTLEAVSGILPEDLRDVFVDNVNLNSTPQNMYNQLMSLMNNQSVIDDTSGEKRMKVRAATMAASIMANSSNKDAVNAILPADVLNMLDSGTDQAIQSDIERMQRGIDQNLTTVNVTGRDVPGRLQNALSSVFNRDVRRVNKSLASILQDPNTTVKTIQEEINSSITKEKQNFDVSKDIDTSIRQFISNTGTNFFSDKSSEKRSNEFNNRLVKALTLSLLDANRDSDSDQRAVRVMTIARALSKPRVQFTDPDGEDAREYYENLQSLFVSIGGSKDEATQRANQTTTRYLDSLYQKYLNSKNRN